MNRLLLITALSSVLVACGGGSGGGSPSSNPTGNTGSLTTGGIDLSKYYFPSSNTTQSYDYYEYDSNNILRSAHEAGGSASYTVDNNTIKYTTVDGDIAKSVIGASTLSLSILSLTANTPRFVDEGKSFNVTFNFPGSMVCTIDRLNSFSMMNDRAEANYANYNDVIKETCTYTLTIAATSGVVTDTDVMISYFALDTGLIGSIDYDCDKYDEINEMWYFDDLNAQNCDDEYTFIDALGPKI